MNVFNVTKNLNVGTVSTYTGTALVLTANALSAGSAGDILNFSAYNEPRAIPSPVAITKVPAAYSLDNFGSVLYAMTSDDGRLLMWDPAVGGLAVVQPPASGRGPVPHGRCFVVTQERFIMIFGSVQDGTAGGGSARRFAWCDQENPGAWDYSNVTSQAGFLDIEPASPIVTAIETRSGVLIWTAKKTYVSQFLGIPYVYNYAELSDAWCIALVAAVDGGDFDCSRCGSPNRACFRLTAPRLRRRGVSGGGPGSTTTSTRLQYGNCRSPAILASSMNFGGFSPPSTAHTIRAQLRTTTRRDGGRRRNYRARRASRRAIPRTPSGPTITSPINMRFTARRPTPTPRCRSSCRLPKRWP